MIRTCILFLAACLACSTAGPDRSPVATMGGCQHRETGVCIDAAAFTHSSKGCENHAIEAHLPAGCPSSGRFASCPLKEGSFIVRVYNQAQLDEVDSLCRTKGGRWAYD